MVKMKVKGERAARCAPGTPLGKGEPGDLQEKLKLWMLLLGMLRMLLPRLKERLSVD